MAPASTEISRLLEAFCLSKMITNQCATAALALVLMLPEFESCLIELPPFRNTKDIDPSQCGTRNVCSDLSGYLGKCIMLSCCAEGITSLLCSTFFDPTVPCNLIGPHTQGIREALEPVRDNPILLARLLAKQNPAFSGFWLAAIWTGRATKIIDCALNGMPPINLLVASWAGVPQSFIQMGYYPVSTRKAYIPRATEFSTLCLIDSEASIPMTPSPPFGETAVTNLNLDIRRHVGHDHRPLRPNIPFRWGHSEPTRGGSKAAEPPIVRIPAITRGSVTDTPEQEYV